MGGFLTISYLYKKAEEDWASKKLITTIDTFSKSIRNIQFPTVTICPGNYHTIDAWAPIERALGEVPIIGATGLKMPV